MVNRYFLLTVLCITFFSISFAQSNKSILSKNDILKYLPEKSDGNPGSFWNHALNDNKEFLDLMDKILNKNGSSAKKARENIASALGETEAYYAKDATILAKLDSAKYDVLGNNSVSNSIHIYYLQYPETNAFCTPQTNVYVYSGLMDALPQEHIYVCFLGVLAHEFAHGLLHHALVHQYKIAKKEKQNELVADIATGLAAYHDSYSRARGTESMVPDVKGYSNKIHIWARQETLRYQFKYSRDMEYQADIVAFRFLDWIGVGGEIYIEALQAMEDPFADNDDYSDHPSMSDRIALLKYMCTQKRVIYN